MLVAFHVALAQDVGLRKEHAGHRQQRRDQQQRLQCRGHHWQFRIEDRKDGRMQCNGKCG